MESVSALIRFAVDNGWRVGIILALAGGAILFADASDWPREGVLGSWLGWATTFLGIGCALLATSGIALILRGVAWVWARLQKRREMARERLEVKANAQSLNPLELEALRDILTRGVTRFEVEMGSAAHRLLSKGMLVSVRDIGGGWICELHPAIQADRDRLLSEIQQRLDWRALQSFREHERRRAASSLPPKE
jgi:hypothetical protein